MSNKELFKEAIAEAKSIRQAAIINAKEALEETLTPQIKSLLAQRLAEMEEEDDKPEIEEEVADNLDTVVAEAEDEEKEEESAEEESEEDKEEAEGGEETDEELEVEDMSVEDLKDLIRDIVGQMVDQDNDGDHDMDDHGMEEPAGDQAPMDMVAIDDEEEIDLDEILAELEADQPVDEAKKPKAKAEGEEIKKLKKELNEAIATVNQLKANLNEVNVLNAKLLYINKLFKASKSLTESQKANIIATFDRANTAKEAQLVYESLKTAITEKPKTTVTEARLGMASKPAGVAPKRQEIITEVSDAVKRMQKLAGIIK
jgi:hypothetical protein